MINHKTNMPTHAIPHTFYLCMDSRKEYCPFYCKIKFDTECVSFDKGFCGYKFKKYGCKTPYEKT